MYWFKMTHIISVSVDLKSGYCFTRFSVPVSYKPAVKVSTRAGISSEVLIEE